MKKKVRVRLFVFAATRLNYVGIHFDTYYGPAFIKIFIEIIASIL